MSSDETPTVEERAASLWNGVAGDLGAAVINTIRKMRLPAVDGGYLGTAERLRFATTTYGEVRRTLLTDTELHRDVLNDTAIEFWSGVRRGTFPADAARGWVFRIVIRTTQRHATARARRLLRCVESTGETSAAELVASPGDSEERLHAHLLAGRLAELVAGLDEADRRLLKAKLANEYDELAREIGVEAGTLRVRAHRLCSSLRAQLTKGRTSTATE